MTQIGVLDVKIPLRIAKKAADNVGIYRFEITPPIAAIYTVKLGIFSEGQPIRGSPFVMEVQSGAVLCALARGVFLKLIRALNLCEGSHVKHATPESQFACRNISSYDADNAYWFYAVPADSMIDMRYESAR